MRTFLIIILAGIASWQSVQLINERDLRRQADEVIEAYRTYTLLQESYANQLEDKYHRTVTVTAYSGHNEPDRDNTAIMEKPRPGIVAVSRDLFNEGWTFGRKVYISGVGVYTIGDLMSDRWTERLDVFIGDTDRAREFGIREAWACLIVGQKEKKE